MGRDASIYESISVHSNRVKEEATHLGKGPRAAVGEPVLPAASDGVICGLMVFDFLRETPRVGMLVKEGLREGEHSGDVNVKVTYLNDFERSTIGNICLEVRRHYDKEGVFLDLVL